MWKVDKDGVFQSKVAAQWADHETTFEADLDGDGYITIETNGDYKLSLHDANQKYYIFDGNGVSIELTNIHGNPVGPATYYGKGAFSEEGSIWNAVQVEESTGGFEVLWSDVGAAALPHIVWKTDTTGKFQNFIDNSLEHHETTFEADLNGDDLITIQTNGDYKIYGGDSNNILDGGAGDDILKGGDGNDVLNGGAGNDTLDGGPGSETITTGSGTDQIILRSGDGGDALPDADIITDFTYDDDNFGLDGGLLFSQLVITQGSDAYANDAIISKGSEYLAILLGIDVSLLSEADFEPVDFA